MAEQATIKYVGLPVDEVRLGMSIPAIFEPTGSYVDSDAYASTPIKLAYFEMAVMESIKAQKAGQEIPVITVDIEDAQDKLWWLQMAPNFVSSGFLVTVGGKTFGADVVANKGE